MIPSGKPHNQMLWVQKTKKKIKFYRKRKGFSLMSKPKSAYSIPGKKGKLDTHIIVVWVDNEAGVLARVVGLFSGRGYNINNLALQK